MQRAWARMENKSPPPCTAGPSPRNVLSEAIMAQTYQASTRETASGDPPRRANLGLMEQSLPEISALGRLQMLLGDFPAQDIGAFG